MSKRGKPKKLSTVERIILHKVKKNHKISGLKLAAEYEWAYLQERRMHRRDDHCDRTARRKYCITK